MNQLSAYNLIIALAAVILTGTACSREATDTPKDADDLARQIQTAQSTLNEDTEVIVISGIDGVIDSLKSENWWGEEMRAEQLAVPHVIVAGIRPAWRVNAQLLSVADKKEVFYRLILPLIVHANEMVKNRRSALIRGQVKLAKGERLSEDELAALRQGAVLLRVSSSEDAAALTQDSPELGGIIDDLLYRLDVIPAGLALGQAAYESGYATSRFAVEGNALFGQWTYGGKGLAPEQQRKNLGDYRIAAFDWLFDSVRGYFINLMSHPAYEEFRRLRAELRAAGEPLTSLRLADGLIGYSERGQEYVDTLKGIILANRLNVADDAIFRDEPLRLAFGAESPEAAARLEQDIQRMRESGEFRQLVARMRLE